MCGSQIFIVPFYFLDALAVTLANKKFLSPPVIPRPPPLIAHPRPSDSHRWPYFPLTRLNETLHTPPKSSQNLIKSKKWLESISSGPSVIFRPLPLVSASIGRPLFPWKLWTPTRLSCLIYQIFMSTYLHLWRLIPSPGIQARVLGPHFPQLAPKEFCLKFASMWPTAYSSRSTMWLPHFGCL